jgi:hypothetical protein
MRTSHDAGQWNQYKVNYSIIYLIILMTDNYIELQYSIIYLITLMTDSYIELSLDTYQLYFIDLTD